MQQQAGVCRKPSSTRPGPRSSHFVSKCAPEWVSLAGLRQPVGGCGGPSPTVTGPAEQERGPHVRMAPRHSVATASKPVPPPGTTLRRGSGHWRSGPHRSGCCPLRACPGRPAPLGQHMCRWQGRPAAASPLQAGAHRTAVTGRGCSALQHLWGRGAWVPAQLPHALCRRGPSKSRAGPSPDLPVQDLTACSACSDIARGVVQADLHTACSPVSWENHPSKQSMRTGRQPLTPGLISTLSTFRSTPWYRWPSRDARVCRQQQTDVPGLPGWCAGPSRGSTPQQNGGLSCQRSCPAAGPCSQAEPHVWLRSVQSLRCEQGSKKELQSGGLQAGHGQAPLQAWWWRFSPRATPAWLRAGTTSDPEPHGMAARSLCRPSTGVQACPPQSHHRCTSEFRRCTLLTLATLP